MGSTTLAIQASIMLAGGGAPPTPTCLVDLDLVSGACADYLDLKANWQLDELIPNPDRLDSHMLDIMMASHSTGVSVLSAQRKFNASALFDAEVITRALDLASQKFQNLIIDLPRHVESWTDSVIHGSNQIFIVTEFTIPGLKSAKRLVADIMERFDGQAEPRVIVNKYKRSVFGSSLSGHEVKEILKSSFAGYVAADPPLVREAIDRGVPITSIKRKNTIVRDLAKIIHTHSGSAS